MAKRGERQGRYFACVLYVNSEELLNCMIQDKRLQIRAYAFIRHDKDTRDNGELMDSHFHLLLRVRNPKTIQQIYKWFYPNEEKQNVFVEFIWNKQGAVDYLTHENEKDKHHYDLSEVVDCGLDDILSEDDDKDESYEIISHLLDKSMTIRELVKCYGRDFVIHFQSYMSVVDSIKQEENHYE